MAATTGALEATSIMNPAQSHEGAQVFEGKTFEGKTFKNKAFEASPPSEINEPSEIGMKGGRRAPVSPSGPGFRAEAIAFRSFEAVLPLLSGLEGTPFQSPFWLSAWFAIFGGKPGLNSFLLCVKDPSGQIVLAMPLVRRREGALTVLEFPDLGVSDYTAPLLRRASIDRLPQGETLWSLVQEALPEADLVHFDRLCPSIAGMPNPLYRHARARGNRLSGWTTPPIESWTAYFATLSSRQRDNSGKNRRRFLRQPEARFIVHDKPDDALSTLARLEAMQECRIKEKGLDYHLDAPLIAEFYRRLVRTGIASGDSMIVEMRAGEETVAANFTVIAGGEAIYLRVGSQFGEWSRMSPGVIVTELAMEEALRRGARAFDFGMGDYVYKRRLGAREMPLRDLVLPLSLRGAPFALLWHARHWASTNPLIRRLSGRASIGAGSIEPPADSASAA